MSESSMLPTVDYIVDSLCAVYTAYKMLLPWHSEPSISAKTLTGSVWVAWCCQLCSRETKTLLKSEIISESSVLFDSWILCIYLDLILGLYTKWHQTEKGKSD